MKRSLILLVLLGVLLSVSVNAQVKQCITIGDDKYCCGEADNVCPQDYEDVQGTRVSCSAPFSDTDCTDNIIECNNGIDDDGNGCSDYPNDLGCSAYTDPDEFGGSCRGAGDCVISDKYWATSTLQKPAGDVTVDIGELGFLVVKGSSGCNGMVVDFSLDGNTDPIDASFVNGQAVSYWIAEKTGTYDFDFDVNNLVGTSSNSLVVGGDHNPLVDLYLTPSFARLKEDDSLQYETLACYLDGVCINVTRNPLTDYESNKPAIVSIDDNGLAKTVCDNCIIGEDIRITATFATVDDTADIEIGTDTEKVVVDPSSKSIEIGETADFDLYYYKNDDPKILVDGQPSVVFSVDEPAVAKVDDVALGIIKGIGMGYTLVTGNYNGLSDDGFLKVGPNGGGPNCGDGVKDPNEICDSNLDCPVDKPSCYNCECASYESVQDCDIYTACVDGTKMITKDCGGDDLPITTPGGSCTPLSTSVPFFGWVHVIITLGLLTGYYIWRRNKL